MTEVSSIEFYSKAQADAKFADAGDVSDMDTRLIAAEGDIDDLETAVGGLATVARTGSYNDLSDKPTFAQVQSDWTQADSSAVDYIKNKPTIPAGVTLYSGTGQNTDGAMTQKASTDALALKADTSAIPTFTAQTGYWTITY